MDGISGGGRGKEWGEVGKFLAFWRVWYIPDDDSAGLREIERAGRGREMHGSKLVHLGRQIKGSRCPSRRIVVRLVFPLIVYIV
jgi:hypothetical protein